jgi:NAD(P)-dependent dehydrogenase (short-subunit alcohol dehydrogenase family)
MRFENTITLITGAGSGIGRACAGRLAREGGAVVCLDIQEETAAETAKAIRDEGGRALGLAGDVAERSDIEAARDAALGEFGALDRLVNSAGMVTMHSLWDLGPEDWHRVLDVNLTGALLAMQVCVPEMEKAGGGAIVNITSIEADAVVTSGDHIQPHYSATKGGLKQLTRALAHDLGRKNIRINAVAPGMIATGFSGSDPTSDKWTAMASSRTALGRDGQADELANAVAFLLSDEASYITGVQLPVDGGWLIY